MLFCVKHNQVIDSSHKRTGTLRTYIRNLHCKFFATHSICTSSNRNALAHRIVSYSNTHTLAQYSCWPITLGVHIASLESSPNHLIAYAICNMQTCMENMYALIIRRALQAAATLLCVALQIKRVPNVAHTHTHGHKHELHNVSRWLTL